MPPSRRRSAAARPKSPEQVSRCPARVTIHVVGVWFAWEILAFWALRSLLHRPRRPQWFRCRGCRASDRSWHEVNFRHLVLSAVFGHGQPEPPRARLILGAGRIGDF